MRSIESSTFQVNQCPKRDQEQLIKTWTVQYLEENPNAYKDIEDFYNVGTVCPLTSCTMSDAGDCNSGTVTNAPYISVVGINGGIQLKANRNIVDGYVYNLCLRCHTAVE